MIFWMASGYGVRGGQWLLLALGRLLARGYNGLDKLRPRIAAHFGAAAGRYNRWHPKREAS